MRATPSPAIAACSRTPALPLRSADCAPRRSDRAPVRVDEGPALGRRAPASSGSAFRSSGAPADSRAAPAAPGAANNPRSSEYTRRVTTVDGAKLCSMRGEHQVVVALEQRHPRVLDVEVHLQLRMAPSSCGRPPTPGGARRTRRARRRARCLAPRALGQRFHGPFAQLRERLGDVAVERFAGVGQPQLARGALQQAGAQLRSSSRATEALRLDLGRSSARAAAVKPPWSTTWQKASKSSQFIVQDSEHSGQHEALISAAAVPTIVPSEAGLNAMETPDVPEELLVRRRLGPRTHRRQDAAAHPPRRGGAALQVARAARSWRCRTAAATAACRCTWAGARATASAACTTA